MIIMAPPMDERPWPTLGLQVADWIETYLVHGPGDLRGQRAHLDDEKRALIARMYELFPHDHPKAGRRRFRRCGISLQKGSAKTELAAFIAAAELHPEAPVRCDGFDADGNPVGRGVTDPFLPLCAYTEEQSDELAFSTLYVVISEGPLANEFDLGLERIMRKRGDGKAVSVAAAPDARDGARTTFEVFDETHRFSSPRLKAAHRTMLANLPKRRMSDPWALEITTAFAPGEGSVAEDTMAYARAVLDGERDDSRLFFFHRQASDVHDVATPEGLRAAVEEAAGPTAIWKDIDGICEQWDDPKADVPYLERTYLNRPVQAASQAFDVNRWNELARPGFVVPDGDLIVLGFDGARHHDSTALIGAHVASGHQWLIGLWEAPLTASGRVAEDWEVDDREVDAVVTAAFERWNVWRMYADPYWWESWLANWQGRWGEKRVIAWRTNRIAQMAYAIRAFTNASIDGDLTHDGDPRVARHIGNARRQETNFRDETGKRLYVIRKERPDSLDKMDAAMAHVLAREARNDAIAAGMLQERPSIYQTRGILKLSDGEEPVVVGAPDQA